MGLMMFQKIIVVLVFLKIFIVDIHAFHIDNTQTKPRNNAILHNNIAEFFRPVAIEIDQEKVLTNPGALLHAAKDSLRYIEQHEKNRPEVIVPAHFESILPLHDVKKTLRYIIQLIQEDKEKGVFRILDPQFLEQHFKFIAWLPDQETAQKNNITLPGQRFLRLTNYAVFSVEGSKTKTKHNNCALYEVKNHAIVKKFTKQNVMAGALEKNQYKDKVKPLAWISRNAFEDALMQGTVLVNFGDNSYKIFNVHLNNGIAYEKSKPVSLQKRYWFFRELKHSTSNVESFQKKIRRRKGVIFAGDIHNIGTGKLIALKYQNPATGKKEIRLGVLADTGSAFVNNLYQLDLFAGLFTSRSEFNQHMKQVPAFTHAYLLSKK